MIIETEWKRFKAIACEGKPAEEVRAIKDIFYCGAAAAVDSILKTMVAGNPDGATLRRIGAVAKEMRRYQLLAEARAKK